MRRFHSFRMRRVPDARVRRTLTVGRPGGDRAASREKAKNGRINASVERVPAFGVRRRAIDAEASTIKSIEIIPTRGNDERDDAVRGSSRTRASRRRSGRSCAVEKNPEGAFHRRTIRPIFDTSLSRETSQRRLVRDVSNEKIFFSRRVTHLVADVAYIVVVVVVVLL
jgi:hypothetical protein